MKLLVALLTLLNINSYAQYSSETPNPDEAFQSFFARITRGAHFPGIYITPSESVRSHFLKTIKKSYWVGCRDKARAELQQQGVNLWGDWFLREDSLNVLLNTNTKFEAFQKSLDEQIIEDQAHCVPNCPTSHAILKTIWKDLDSFSKQSVVKAFVLRVPLFSGRPLIAYLSDVYQYSSWDVLNGTKIKLLSDRDFILAVRELGFEGEIYFRGLTAPDPKNPRGHVILLNEEKLFKYSPFDRTILKMGEVIGILTHELSHVFQDLKGRSLGYDVQVRSAEAALLLEGSAEYLAEQAMTLAAAKEPAPSFLSMMVREQAVEILYREGNESTGRLFPYTVGLPFVAALYGKVGPENNEILTKKILEFLAGPNDLQKWLEQDLFN